MENQVDQFMLDCAMMAGCAYRSTRHVKNSFPSPSGSGWEEIAASYDERDSGFEAVSFRKGNQIVISFAGTDPDDVTGDVVACLGLGVGNGSKQLKEAAEYYLKLKQKPENADVQFVFTGHSLGGGIAALLSVFFNVQAVTFDEAPFGASATVSVRDGLKDYLTTSQDSNPAAFDLATLQSLAPDFFTFTTENLAQRTGNITGKYVEGEFLEADWPYSGLSRIGTPECMPLVSRGASGKDLHAQALLTAFLANPDFQAVTSKLKDLAAQIFDEALYCFDTKLNTENFIDRLIRYEFGNAPEATDTDMLKRFTEDLEKIAKEGGLSLTDDNMKKTLTAFAMQMYYTDESTKEENRHLFNTDGITEGGGLHFKMSDVAASLTGEEGAKGYNLYFQDYLNGWKPEEKAAALSELPGTEDWYVQAGVPALKAKAGAERAFMIGGDKADELTGGGASDVLYGGKGQDKLTGGAGNDLLIGGEGEDTYYFYQGDAGNDKLIDSGLNTLVFERPDGKMIPVKTLYGIDGNIYKTMDGSVEINMTDNHRFTYGEGGSLEIPSNLDPHEIGINLVTFSPDPVTNNTINVDPEAVGSTYGTGQSDRIEGTSGGDSIIDPYGGNDWILAGGGDDYISLRRDVAGYAVIEGGAGTDVVQGSIGSDRIYGDSMGDMYALIAEGETAEGVDEKGELISGAPGNDFIYGTARRDALFGGQHHDLLVGGAGDDIIFGDYEIYDPSMDWSISIQQDENGYTPVGVNVTLLTMEDSGDDLIYAGAGNDYVEGNNGDDEIYGGSGTDVIFGNGGNDFIDGGDDDDYLVGDGRPDEVGNDHIYGGNGDDVIFGGGGSDALYGGAGDDEIHGDNEADDGNDYISGDEGNDTLFGYGGDDTIFGGAGNDIIEGDRENVAVSGNDYLDGGDGDDQIWGQGGNDIIFGGAGADYIEGNEGDDRLNGGDGDDTVIGAEGADIIHGESGNDSLHGDAANVPLEAQGDDYIDGGDGDDVINGYGGNDTLDGGAGNDTIVGGIGDDSIFGEDGDDTIQGDDGNDIISGGAGMDIIFGGAGNDDISGGTEDDQIQGDDGDDQIKGGAGNDILLGGAGNDHIMGEDGDDHLQGDEGNDYLDGGSGNDILVGLDGNDRLYGGGGADQIWGGDGADTIDGEAGNDWLAGENGDDVISGGDGNDTLYGGSGNDVLDGGSGADTMIGGDGDDTYVIDHISDMVGENPDEGTDTVRSFISCSLGSNIENLTLAGNAAINGYGNALDNIILGNDAANMLYGESGNDTLSGGDGNDMLSGGAGSDTYIFTSGNDTIQEYNWNNDTSVDVVKFGPEITLADLEMSRVDSNLKITIKNTSNSLTIKDWFASGGEFFPVDQFMFDDGTIVTAYELTQAIAFPLNGTPQNDALQGTNFADDMDGQDGDDTLWGYKGNDILRGGAGNDILRGGVGSDRYVFNLGDGSDVIWEESGNPQDVNVLEFGNGILPADITMVKDTGGVCTLSIAGTTDQIRIYNWAFPQIQRIQFADGTVWDASYIQGRLYPVTDDDDVIYGTNGHETLSGLDGNDTIYGGDGDDIIHGGNGNDYLDGGNGNDVLDGGSGVDTMTGGTGDDTYLFGHGSGHDIVRLWGGGTDTILLDSSVSPSDIILWRYNYLGTNGYTRYITDDLVLSIGAIPSLPPSAEDRVLSTMNGEEIIAASTDSVTIQDWFKSPGLGIRFADGTIWDAAQIYDWYCQGAAGNDRIYGLSTDDVLSGGNGDDYLYGGSGNDVLSGGQGMDTLYGDYGDDTLDGGPGTDRLFGGRGSDTYMLCRGMGYDMISDYHSEMTDLNIISVAAGISPTELVLKRKYDDLEVRISGTGDSMEVYDHFGGSGGYRIDLIQFADGTVWDVDTINQMAPQATEEDDWIRGSESADTLVGLGGNDTILGLGGNDTIDGGPGNDFLEGGEGDDTYLFGRGSGHDSIGRFDEMTNGIDTILLDSDVLPTDVVLSRESDDLVLTIADTGDTLIAGGWFMDNEIFSVDAIRFADGTVWDVETINEMIGIQGTDGDDILQGDDADNQIWGLAGNDTLYGYAGDDYLDGGTGKDTMRGGSGNDIYVVDNTGDVVMENANEGVDTVHSAVTYTLGNHVENLIVTGTLAINGTGNALSNELAGNAGNNILDGKAGADTMIGGAGNDTYVVDNGGDIVFEDADEGIDTVRSSVTYTLGNNVENLTLTGTSAINGTGNALDNMLIGNSKANTLTGGAGNDTLDGGAGNDTMRGGLGDDIYVVGSTGDVVAENADEGIDTVRSSVTYTLGNNVENLTLTGTSAINGTGNALDNILVGNSAANTLTGGAGNDSLDGGAGKDTMRGGSGDDIYVVDNTGDIVTENANEGIDTIRSSVSFTLGNNVENLILTGASAINATGNTLNNTLIGNSAANTLTGNNGNDIMDGGAGNDNLRGGNGSDTYLFRRTDGVDTITETAGSAGDSDVVRMIDGIGQSEPVIVKQDNDLYLFIDANNYMKINSEFAQPNYGIERLEVSDGHYITRTDIENIVNTMSAINNDPGMDVIQKFNAMRVDQTYINTLAQSWQQP